MDRQSQLSLKDKQMIIMEDKLDKLLRIENKNNYCPLSIEIKGKLYCFKSFSLDKECTKCIIKQKKAS